MSLTLKGIWFSYPRSPHPLLEDINLAVADGQSVALMGPSGAGKSTLLNIAGLLQSPNRGEVLIDGRHVTTRDAARLLGSTVGWVLQSVNLLPRRTLLDNVLLPSRAHRQDPRRAGHRAEELLTALGLSEHVARQARTLSGGEAQRAGIARALMTEPSLLIADEPTANLDQVTAMEVSERLISAAGSTALLLATHDPAVAALADRVVTIEHWKPRIEAGHVDA